jgi:hypothetical protein
VRCEEGCTRLDESLAIKLEGKREDLQWIQALVPLCHLSLNRNVCSLRRRFSVGYSDVKLPLEERILLDTWDINSPND